MMMLKKTIGVVGRGLGWGECGSINLLFTLDGIKQIFATFSDSLHNLSSFPPNFYKTSTKFLKTLPNFNKICQILPNLSK